MGCLSIRGEAGHLTIEVLGYENRRADNTDDANWLQSLVGLEFENLVVRLGASLRTQELRCFHDALDGALRSLEGKAVLNACEEVISLSVEFGSRGSARILGELLHCGMTNYSVKFAFDSDQSHLRNTLSQLREVLIKYPVVDHV